MPLIHRILFHHFIEDHSISRAIRDTQLDRATVSKIFNFARYAVHMLEIADRFYNPICEISVIEHENIAI
jgi:hypothetical protein